MARYFQLRSFITYWLDAVDRHSLHSPFFFDFYTQVVTAQKDTLAYAPIEALRQQLRTSSEQIHVLDLGAGATTKPALRNVADIARTSVSPEKFSRLYARIIEHYQCKHVVELGTCVGINTLYLAQHASTVTTFEGAPALASIARKSFQQSGTNIRIIEGDISQTLSSFQPTSRIDFAFLDANHRYEPTIRYFHYLSQWAHVQSIFVLDDIHYSPDMEKAWNELRKHPLIYGSADLYRCGILFFDPSLNKQHVVLQF